MKRSKQWEIDSCCFLSFSVSFTRRMDAGEGGKGDGGKEANSQDDKSKIATINR
ncbi:hypothetical protein PG301_27900 [Parageobacillus sp. G301]|nr:hypothetical protein PG301_27900 [Parageobacillus sp. G301]